LEQKRKAFTQAGKEKRASMAPGLLDLEKHVESLDISIQKMEMDTRNAENRFLQKK
jgi:hypothetical protein